MRHEVLVRRGMGGALAGALLAGTLGVIAGPAHAEPVAEPRSTYLGRSLYTGEFHSHTSVSDGVLLPDDAFDHVHDETQADFFTLSEHDVMWDLRNGDDFIDDWRDAESTEWRYLHEQVEAYNAAQDELVAVPSIENTWYDGTGHINVFNADWKATARATEKGSVDGFGNAFGTGDMKYDMYTFFARLKQDPEAIAQFNHPSRTGKGNFFDFNGLDRQVDDRIDLIEVRSAAQGDQFVNALDKGWHLSPVWNGDEHSATWVTSNQAITGLWAEGHSLDDLYAAMRERSTYSTQDVNVELAFGGNGRLMGSILPGDTSEVTFDARLIDPDARDEFTKVELVTNGGEVAHLFPGVGGRSLELTHTRAVADGDYYFLRATQADGHLVYSAPLWIGETTRGADYAPQIDVASGFPTSAGYGSTIALPEVSATDDSGATPQLSFEVYDSAGQVPVVDGGFGIRSYEDHFVVVKATDAGGNIGAELLRITVDQDDLDPAGVFQHFGSTAVVTEQPGGAGLAVSTDRAIAKVYAQVLPEGSEDWTVAPVLTSTNDRPYEVNAIGNDEPVYQHAITGQTLRSHEFDLEALIDGGSYRYRFGVAVDGEAPRADDAGAWTDVQGEFVAGGAGNEPIYAIGDLQATSHDPGDLGLLRDVLDRLQEKAPGGRTLLQTGDLVDNGGRGQYWQEVFDHVFDGLDVQYAPVAGNHETYGDLDYDSQSQERTAIFGNMFNTPKNGAIGESNYSFNRGDVHIAVLNSVHDMEKQLNWLAKDIRASDRRWNVVTGHYSYYGGSHGSDGPLAADRPKLTAAFERLGVDLYIGGHDHIYKRSTVYDGRLAATPEEEARGTTFVTLGSAGPKFYDNVAYWWDDVVFDENTQVGTVLEPSEDGLRLTTYTVDGREVDSYTVRKPQGYWKVTSTDVVDRELAGIGVVSSEGTPERTTLIAATYDRSGTTLRDLRSAEAVLDHEGSEQLVRFASPLPVAPGDTLKVFAWDGLGTARPMRAPILAQEGIDGEGTAEDPYRIAGAADLDKIANDPSGHYLLTADLDLGGTVRPQVDQLVTFRGVLDGGGHTISGFDAGEAGGAGLFADNYGTIRNLVVRNEVTRTRGTLGLVADTNHGLIERVHTAGSIAGTTRVGGIVGDHYGTIRDSYSTANVSTTGLYAGGVVAIAIGESTSERIYSTGSVKATGRNAGGVVSYGYENTHVSQSVSLNKVVQGTSFAHAIVGRVADGQLADLQRNYASSAVSVLGETLTDPPAPDNWKGGVRPAVELRTAAFFADLGWNLESVWEWHAKAKRPVLRTAREQIDDTAVAPTLPQDTDGAYLIGSGEDLRKAAAFPDESYRLSGDVDLAGLDLPQLGADGAFNGVLDGAGHTLSHWTSTKGGPFALIGAQGRVHDLGVADVAITKPGARAGGLVDTLRGTVERVWTSGEVRAGSYAAGVAGDSFGTIRDAYSTANVRTTGGNYAGGIIGVADSPSTTERVYATGAVTASGTSAGGVSGYARNSQTVLRQAFALNPTVTGTTTSQRVVARAANGETAALSALYAVETVVAGVQSVPAEGPQTLNGATRTVAQATDAATWRTELGFDLDQVWEWSANGKRPVLQGATEQVAAPAGPTAEQDGEGYWLIRTPAELAKVATSPGESFRLAADLDLAGTEVRIESFSGRFDGAGHTIRGLTSTKGGLFGALTAEATVSDLALLDVAITKPTLKAGALVDTLRGTVERVRTSGEVRVHSYAGGIAAESFGTIRDSWSAVNATTTVADYAGGIVGVADSPSTTERVYVTGSVVSVKAAAGGVAGYARNSGTVIRQAVVLSPQVTATANAHRVVARFATGQTASLADLFAIDTLVPSVQTVTATGPSTVNGETRTGAELALPATWSAIGFGLDDVWSWDAEAERPVLALPAGGAGGVTADRSAALEPALEPGVARGSVVSADDRAVDRVAAAARTAAPEVVDDAAGERSHLVEVDGDRTRVSLSLGSGAGDEPAGVVVLAPGADLRDPKPADVLFLDQVGLDAAGQGSFAGAVGPLGRQRLVVGSADERGRYLARLDPSAAADPVGLTAVDLRIVEGAEAVLSVQTEAVGATGEVTFAVGEDALGAAELDSGSASLTLAAGRLPVGSHQVTVRYAGDELFAAASTTLRLTVEASSGHRAELGVGTLAQRWGSAATLRVTVSGEHGLPTGSVRLYRGEVQVASGRVVDGVAVVRVPALALRVGSHRLRVVYDGDARYGPVSAEVAARVAKAAASLKVLKVSPKKIRAKKSKAVLRVRVQVPAGVSATGTVTVRGAGIKARSVRVVRGVATVNVGKLRRPGVKRLSVVYSGSKDVERASRTVRIKVRR